MKLLTREQKARRAVLAVAGIMLFAKAWLAWRTLGQDDTNFWWPRFMHQVHDAGPIGVYALPSASQPYNHPPLVGWWLEGLSLISALAGKHLGFYIRGSSILADFFCAWVMFEVLRRRRTLWQATAAGILIATSPVLYVISGYHGNHDPEMMFLAILSAFLLVDKKMPITAGVSLALAVSLKLPAATLVPVVFAAALALGWPVLRRFAAGFGAVIAVLWLPPLIEQTTPFISNVLLYSGNSFPRQWGLVQFAQGLGASKAIIDPYVSPGRLILLVVVAALGVWFAWRRPDLTVAAIGVTMATFLLLSPGFAPQYMVWPVAALYAVNFWPATAYNLSAGVFVLALYNSWSRTFPWYYTLTVALTPAQVIELGLVWAVLLWAVIDGIRRLRRETRRPQPSPTPAPPPTPAPALPTQAGVDVAASPDRDEAALAGQGGSPATS